MVARSSTGLVLAILAGSVVGCGDDPAPSSLCSPDDLTQALASAQPGDVVEVGACRIRGAFEVPAGVTLAGQGTETSSVEGLADEVAIRLSPGASATVLRGLSVESNGPVGVRMSGAGGVAIEDVEVTASKGVAIGAADLDELTLTGVSVLGPVTRESAGGIPSDASPDEFATHGVVLVGVGSATLANVSGSGFALAGALFVDTHATWSGGQLTSNLGTGLQVQGGAVTLTDLEVAETLQGTQLAPAIAVVVSAGAQVDSERLSLLDNDTLGLVQSGAPGTHVELTAEGGGDAAVWIQRADGVEIQGAGLADNGFAGVVVLESTAVTLSGIAVERTALVTSIGGLQGRIDVGDGIQLVASTEAVLVEDATLAGNERVGLLVDLGGGSADGLSIANVAVDAAGEALGAVFQNGTPPAAWTGAVDRRGAAAANDAAFAASGDVLPLAEALEDVPVADPDGVRAIMGPNY